MSKSKIRELILPCIDPTPAIEEKLLSQTATVPKQLEMTSKLVNIFNSLSEHFTSISSDLNELSQSLPTGPQMELYSKSAQNLSSFFSSISEEINENCKNPLTNFRAELVQPVLDFREEYLRARTNFSKTVEEFAAVTDKFEKSHSDLANMLTSLFVTTFTERANSFYLLSRANEAILTKGPSTILAAVFNSLKSIYTHLLSLDRNEAESFLTHVVHHPPISSVPRISACSTTSEQYLIARLGPLPLSLNSTNQAQSSRRVRTQSYRLPPMIKTNNSIPQNSRPIVHPPVPSQSSESSSSVNSSESSDTSKRSVDRSSTSNLDDTLRIRYIPDGLYSKPNGIVWIRSHFIRTTWTRRYLSFDDGVLTAIALQPDGKKLSWDLSLISVVPLNKKKRRFCFKIITPNDEIQIQALTEFDRQGWISVLQNHNSSFLGEGTGSGEQCADCGAQNAQWVSLNWGVSLCLQCSGIHRDLASHISKVRSLCLDDLHPYLVELHRALGNNIANELLLHDNHPVLPSNAPMSERKEFITSKYLRRCWANKEESPSPFVAIANGDLRALFWSMNFGRAEERLDNGITPIHAAVMRGEPLLIALCVAATQDVDVIDDRGWTPLAYAVFFGDEESSILLMGNGAKAERPRPSLLVMAIARSQEKLAIKIAETMHKPPPQQIEQKIFEPLSREFALDQRREIPPIEISPQLLQRAHDLYYSIHPASNV